MSKPGICTVGLVHKQNKPVLMRLLNTCATHIAGARNMFVLLKMQKAAVNNNNNNFIYPFV